MRSHGSVGGVAFVLVVCLILVAVDGSSGAAVHWSSWTYNHVLHSSTGETPVQRLHKEEAASLPSLKKLRTFGQKCMYVVERAKNDRMAPRSMPATLVGYSLQSDAWIVEPLGTHQRVTTNDVVFLKEPSPPQNDQDDIFADDAAAPLDPADDAVAPPADADEAPAAVEAPAAASSEDRRSDRPRKHNTRLEGYVAHTRVLHGSLITTDLSDPFAEAPAAIVHATTFSSKYSGQQWDAARAKEMNAIDDKQASVRKHRKARIAVIEPPEQVLEAQRAKISAANAAKAKLKEQQVRHFFQQKREQMIQAVRPKLAVVYCHGHKDQEESATLSLPHRRFVFIDVDPDKRPDILAAAGTEAIEKQLKDKHQAPPGSVDDVYMIGCPWFVFQPEHDVLATARQIGHLLRRGGHLYIDNVLGFEPPLVPANFFDGVRQVLEKDGGLTYEGPRSNEIEQWSRARGFQMAVFAKPL